MTMKLSEYADKNQLSLYKHFPSTHYLSSPKRVLNTLAWTTFFRRNMNRCATDYLGIKLYPYQEIVLYELGVMDLVNVVGSRCIAKSFLIGLYASCHAIMYPHSEIVIASATLKQAENIITNKILGELCNMSPVLRSEIRKVERVNNDLKLWFKNGSYITVAVANDNARSARSTLLIREESRMLKKRIDDQVLTPFQHVRTVEFKKLEDYEDNPEIVEEPKNAYITSSWFDNGQAMWKIADDAYAEALKGGNQCLLAFDISVVLKHRMKTKNQLMLERKKLDSVSWRIEYLNERVKENTGAFFSYQELAQQQVIKRAFYPRKTIDVLHGKKNPYEIPKQDGEIRVITCDMAFVENKRNDNSIFGCMRLLPESVVHTLSDKSIETNNGYRRQVSYIESMQGGDTDKQALRIRQLFEDFKADYIVLDRHNAGLSVYDRLAKVLYDDEREVEYSPFTCMNDDDIANRVKTPNAKPCIFVIAASEALNSDIASTLKTTLQDKKIDFLIPYNMAMETQLPKIEEYKKSVELFDQLFFEKPYLETQEFINETNSLVYSIKEQTKRIVVKEKGNNRKDRYTSISYGNYFASLLERELVSTEDNYDFVALFN